MAETPKGHIDASCERFKALCTEIAGYEATIESEEDTRLKVINRVLTEVLGWAIADLRTERRAGKGFVDYLLYHNEVARVVLEAKRDSRAFELKPRSPGQAYKLTGPVFSAKDVQEGIHQAIEYSAYKNTELSCVTNGHEWMIFRSNRLGDGKDTLEGYGFVFPSLEAILENFARFYDLLSREHVLKLTFRAYFQEAEGLPIRHHSFHKAVRAPETAQLLRRDHAASDMDRVMTSFFQRLSGDSDPEMIGDCFVVTKESQLADEKLIRISEDLVDKIRSLNTATGEQLATIIDQVQTTRTNTFVVLIGTKGAGKSTFIDRFFTRVLSQELAERCVTMRVNIGESEGDEQTVAKWLNFTLLKIAEEAIFETNVPTWDEIIGGIFFDEYQRWSKGSMSHLYETDRGAFRVKFGDHVERIRQDYPQDYIKRLLAHAVRSRRKVPCIVLDNADHFSIEFQERVFQYIRAIYENELCLVIMPITDKTSWQLSQQGALQSFETESLYLPTPPAKVILDRRVKFLGKKLSTLPEKQSAEYFIGRGIRLDIKNLSAFAATLQSIFVETGEVSHWIASFSNHDIRRVLELSRDIVASPHIKLDQLLKAYITGSSIPLSIAAIKSALVKGKYDIYPIGRHKFVQNIFALHTEIPTTPLLGLRILQLLRDSQFRDVEGKRTFVSIDQIYEYFLGMGCERRAVTCSLEAMLKTGLCWNYDPTVNEVTRATQIELSPAGNQHLIWGTNDVDYLEAMAYVTPLADKGFFETLFGIATSRPKFWHQQLVHQFIDYLLDDDATYCVLPEHDAYKGQHLVEKRLRRLKRRAFVVGA